MAEKKEYLDKSIESVTNEPVDPELAQRAAGRVWDRIGGGASRDAGARLSSCVDFRALFGAYIEGTLGGARCLLLDDHLHECVACRKALDTARGRLRAMPPRRGTAQRSPSMVWKWTAAAVLLVMAGAGSLMLFPPPGMRAAIENVDGGLYLVTAQGARPLPAPTVIEEGAQVRTGRGGRAVLRLHDGSRVELAERTEVRLHRGWFVTAVNLDKGSVIVQAAKQGWTHRLDVVTMDARARVRGTVFAVSAGEKGSRVSVIDGAVQVNSNGQEQLLRPGEQATSDPTLLKTAVAEEVSWSRNAPQYYALLGDVRAMAAKLQAAPGPGLRYTSRLVPLLPPDTVFVAALPNIGTTLDNASAIFNERLKESPTLAAWWAEQGTKAAEIERAFEMLRTVTGYLGDEVVVAVTSTGNQPVMLAEVKKSGLKEYVASQLTSAGAPANAVAEMQDHVLIVNGIAAASPDKALLARMGQALASAAPTGFAGTPFGTQIAKSYAGGASWLFCADLEQTVAKSVSSDKAGQASGMGDVRYLVIERKEAGDGRTESAATLAFAGPRRGVASWLGNPGKMGALDFISPEATFAVALALKNPDAMLTDILQMAGKNNNDAAAGLAELEGKVGLRIREDIVQALGSEIVFAVDGPLLPRPAWKVVVEVNDANRIKYAIDQLMKLAQQAAAQEGGGKTLEWTHQQSGGGDVYRVGVAGKPIEQVWYAFSEGYLVAASSGEQVTAAIAQHRNGYSLVRSDNFRKNLPRDGQASFSAVMYERLGPALGEVASALNATGAVKPEQRQALEALAKNDQPALLYAYADADRIRVGTSSDLLGMALDSVLAGGGPGRGHSGVAGAVHKRPAQGKTQ